MNFLAHLWLSGEDPGMRVGGFLGDFVRGGLNGRYPPSVEAGIRLHRFLDARTDRDPAVRASVARFPPPYRRYAPLIVDVLWDHFLVRHFPRIADESVTAYTAKVYADLARHRAVLPPAAERFRRRMTDHDLLAAYGELETVHRALARIGARLSRSNPLHRADAPLAALAPALEADFLHAFPRISDAAHDWRRDHPAMHDRAGASALD